MEYRVLVRFVGSKEDLTCLRESFLDKFTEAELLDEGLGEWYSVDDVMLDEYECHFEELPEGELLAMDGSFVVDELPIDFLEEFMERYERVYGVFKWSSTEVGFSCGVSESWGEFNPDYADDGSDEAYEISEAVLGF